MNPYPDVEHRAGLAAAEAAATAQPAGAAQPSAPAPAVATANPDSGQPNPARGGGQAARRRPHGASGARATERLSIDPLRATDRYRLAAPIDLRL